MRKVWESLKRGDTQYLSARQKTMLSDYIRGLDKAEQKYYKQSFKFKIDPDDRERSTYECYCTESFGMYQAKYDTHEKEVELKEEFVEKMNKLEVVMTMIESIESHFNISVLARGGSYGSARLVVKDNKTDEELTRN